MNETTFLLEARPFHTVCTIQYYKKAIAYIQAEIEFPQFYIFSDDIQWCSKNLHLPNSSFIDIEASQKNSAIDLYLMSLCNTNST